jgi:hypothetical protein
LPYGDDTYLTVVRFHGKGELTEKGQASLSIAVCQHLLRKATRGLPHKLPDPRGDDLGDFIRTAGSNIW